MEDFRQAQQGLGRNTSPVKADAAEMLALDDRRLQTELRRADRGDIAARPAADDDDVVGVGHSVNACRHSSIPAGCFDQILNAARSSAPKTPSTAR